MPARGGKEQGNRCSLANSATSPLTGHARTTLAGSATRLRRLLTFGRITGAWVVEPGTEDGGGGTDRARDGSQRGRGRARRAWRRVPVRRAGPRRLPDLRCADQRVQRQADRRAQRAGHLVRGGCLVLG